MPNNKKKPTVKKRQSAKERKNHEGNVYFGKTRYIDFDKKPRRRYVVISDDGKRVKVAKLTSLDEKKEADNRFLPIKSYPGLKKKTAVYQSLYSRNRITKKPLSVSPKNGVFDEKPVFALDDEDFQRADRHVIKRGIRAKKKGR